MAVSIVDKLQFLSFIFAVLLSVTVHLHRVSKNDTDVAYYNFNAD